MISKKLYLHYMRMLIHNGQSFWSNGFCKEYFNIFLCIILFPPLWPHPTPKNNYLNKRLFIRTEDASSQVSAYVDSRFLRRKFLKDTNILPNLNLPHLRILRDKISLYKWFTDRWTDKRLTRNYQNSLL